MSQKQSIFSSTAGWTRHDPEEPLTDAGRTNKWEDATKIENRVSYDSDSFFGLLFRYSGTVWPKVLPYCIVNVLLTCLILLCKDYWEDYTFPDYGHSFMGLALSFFLVNRANTIYSRYMLQRSELEACLRACKELIHYACIFTRLDKTEGARQWRSEVAYRTIVLLRVTMAALEHVSTEINTWDMEDLGEEERATIHLNTFLTPQRKSHRRLTSESAGSHDGSVASGSSEGSRARNRRKGLLRQRTCRGEDLVATNVSRWAHGFRSQRDENFRAPIVMCYKLRAAVVSHKNGRLEERMHVNEERELLNLISDFFKAYENLRCIIVTPYIFPFLQMGRTFLFFWVFTLPFALADDFVKPLCLLMMVFAVTYGFIGTECVMMELDDPFGDDENDFEDITLSQMVFEDIYWAIWSVSGYKSADALRDKVAFRSKMGDPLEQYVHENMDLFETNDVFDHPEIIQEE